METGLTLTSDMMLVLVVLAITIALFVFEVVRVDVVALLVLVLLGLSSLVPEYNGLIPVYQLFEGAQTIIKPKTYQASFYLDFLQSSLRSA